MAFAPLLVARKAGQRMLHQPDIFATLDRSGRFPHGSEPASWHRPPEPRIGRPEQRDGWASSCSGEVSDRGIRADEEPGAGQQCGKLWPRQLPVAAHDVRENAPYPVEI